MAEKAKRKWERRSAGLIESALERLKRGERIKDLSEELGVPRSLLYWWRLRAERRRKESGAESAGGPQDERAKRKWERRSAALIETALERMKRGEKIRDLSQELKVSCSLLYWWRLRAEGRLNGSGHAASGPATGTDEDVQERRIRELEKQVHQLKESLGEKTLELDFFAAALRRIKETRQKRSSSGERASTR